METESPDLFDLLNLPKPGTPEFTQYAFALTKRIAASLAAAGWRFHHKEGPRGHYYEGFGPGGVRMMSQQRADLQDAYLVCLRQANSIHFPLSRF